MAIWVGSASARAIKEGPAGVPWYLAPLVDAGQVADVWKRIEAQADACRWLAETRREVDALTGRDNSGAAALLHELARRCFHDRTLFRSLLVDQQGVTRRENWAATAASPFDLVPPDTGYRQAATPSRKRRRLSAESAAGSSTTAR